jgi:hypothetical protein
VRRDIMTVSPSGGIQDWDFDDRKGHPFQFLKAGVVAVRPMINCLALAFFALLLLAPGVRAQGTTSPMESITEAELRDHVFFLASDFLRGRQTSSDAFRVAAEYSAVHLRQSGLQTLYADSSGAPSFFHNVQFVYSRVSRSATMTIHTEGPELALAYGDGFQLQEVMATGADRSIDDTPVFVGYGIEEPELGWNDFEGLDLDGRVAVMVAGAPTNNGEPILPAEQSRRYGDLGGSISRRVESAMSRGVTTLIVVIDQGSTDYWEMMSRRFRGPSTRVASEGQEGDPVPALSELILLKPETSVGLLAGTGFDPISGEGEYTTGPMEGVRVSLTIPHDVEPAFTSPNVVGLLPGTDPALKEEYIVVTAHLDHLGVRSGNVFNGADDNASGSAAVLEVAEAMAMDPGRRSVLFVLLTGEEMGLLGAFAFAGNPPVPTDQMVLNINLDMVGRNSPSFPDALLALGSEQGRAGLLEMIREVNGEVGAPLDLRLNGGDDAHGYLERSDQFAFMQKGIPAILITRGFTGGDYHRPTDDPETINYQKVLRAARSTLALVQEAANREDVEFDGSR